MLPPLPGAAAGRRHRSSHPAVSAFPDNVVGSACTSSFSRIAQRSLALRPAHSRGHLYVTCYTEGFSHFVTSMTAPVASGWSVRRVGLAPTGERRLVTAHTLSGHSGSADSAIPLHCSFSSQNLQSCSRLNSSVESTKDRSFSWSDLSWPAALKIGQVASVLSLGMPCLTNAPQ